MPTAQNKVLCGLQYGMAMYTTSTVIISIKDVFLTAECDSRGALEWTFAGGIAVDAKKLSEPERERLTRKFVQAFKVLPERDR